MIAWLSGWWYREDQREALRQAEHDLRQAVADNTRVSEIAKEVSEKETVRTRELIDTIEDTIKIVRGAQQRRR